MYRTPNEIYQELFTDLHKSGLWHDGKIISDAIPKVVPENILAAYRSSKKDPDFDLKAFFEQYFEIKKAGSSDFESDTSRPVEEHIRVLWDHLTREADVAIEGASLIPLPYPYIVPGGRFNEIYYWDSYFTMLGLKVHGRVDLIESMVDNFSWLIENIGHIPNGNRTYFLGRSHPPFYSLMVGVLAEVKGDEVWVKYLPFLEKEYAYWMMREEGTAQASLHTVAMPDGSMMNRYYDRVHQERMEMYADDRELADRAGREEAKLFLDLRAACESGWDFSARWQDDPMDLATTRASDMIPVDLNSLLWNLEHSLAKAYALKGEQVEYDNFTHKANSRKAAIQKYLWDEKSGFFYD
jgi:alpha,alpha-trehalase